MYIKEYVPNGCANWMEYYKLVESRNKKIENIKSNIAGVVITVVLLAAYIGVAYIETML